MGLVGDAAYSTVSQGAGEHSAVVAAIADKSADMVHNGPSLPCPAPNSSLTLSRPSYPEVSRDRS